MCSSHLGGRFLPVDGERGTRKQSLHQVGVAGSAQHDENILRMKERMILAPKNGNYMRGFNTSPLAFSWLIGTPIATNLSTRFSILSRV